LHDQPSFISFVSKTWQYSLKLDAIALNDTKVRVSDTDDKMNHHTLWSY